VRTTVTLDVAKAKKERVSTGSDDDDAPRDAMTVGALGGF